MQIINLSKAFLKLERSIDGHQSLLELLSSIPGPRITSTSNSLMGFFQGEGDLRLRKKNLLVETIVH